MSFICYINFFTNAQGPSVKVDSEPQKKGSGECKVNELSVKVVHLSMVCPRMGGGRATQGKFDMFRF